MIRRPPRSTRLNSSAASDVYKRQIIYCRRGMMIQASSNTVVIISISIITIIITIDGGKFDVNGILFPCSCNDKSFRICYMISKQNECKDKIRGRILHHKHIFLLIVCVSLALSTVFCFILSTCSVGTLLVEADALLAFSSVDN